MQLQRTTKVWLSVVGGIAIIILLVSTIHKGKDSEIDAVIDTIHVDDPNAPQIMKVYTVIELTSPRGVVMEDEQGQKSTAPTATTVNVGEKVFLLRVKYNESGKEMGIVFPIEPQWNIR